MSTAWSNLFQPFGHPKDWKVLSLPVWEVQKLMGVSHHSSTGQPTRGPKPAPMSHFSPDSLIISLPLSNNCCGLPVVLLRTSLVVGGDSVLVLGGDSVLVGGDAWLSQYFDLRNHFHQTSLPSWLMVQISGMEGAFLGHSHSCPEGFDPILVLLYQNMLCWSRGGGARG